MRLSSNQTGTEASGWHHLGGRFKNQTYGTRSNRYNKAQRSASACRSQRITSEQRESSQCLAPSLLNGGGSHKGLEGAVGDWNQETLNQL